MEEVLDVKGKQKKGAPNFVRQALLNKSLVYHKNLFNASIVIATPAQNLFMVAHPCTGSWAL